MGAGMSWRRWGAAWGAAWGKAWGYLSDFVARFARPGEFVVVVGEPQASVTPNGPAEAAASPVLVSALVAGVVEARASGFVTCNVVTPLVGVVVS